MNSYVVDTNALLGYITDSPKLSRRASQAFDEGARGQAILYLPAIVIAELYYANVKLGYPFDFEETYRQISAASQFVLLPFEAEDVLAFDACAAVPEMHDRMIVAAARKFDAGCITTDTAIERSGLVKVIW